MQKINFKFDKNYIDSYMEIPGHDVRIAIKKAKAFERTLSDAQFSLIYCEESIHKTSDQRELNIIRRFHLRHAIIDLNNCYDILLQIPWFLYRIWNAYNIEGNLHRKAKKNYKDINRNTDGWVEKAQKQCWDDGVVMFLKNSPLQELNSLGSEIIKFKKEYIINPQKLTIRKLSNLMKHSSELELKELNQPMELGLIVNDHRIDLRSFHSESKPISFWSEDDENLQGHMRFENTDDFYLNIEYDDGEKFRAKDYLNYDNIYEINLVREKCVEFFNEINILYEKLYNEIKNKISKNPFFPKLTENISYIDFNQYFLKNTD